MKSVCEGDRDSRSPRFQGNLAEADPRLNSMVTNGVGRSYETDDLGQLSCIAPRKATENFDSGSGNHCSSNASRAVEPTFRWHRRDSGWEGSDSWGEAGFLAACPRSASGTLPRSSRACIARADRTFGSGAVQLPWEEGTCC